MQTLFSVFICASPHDLSHFCLFLVTKFSLDIIVIHRQPWFFLCIVGDYSQDSQLYLATPMGHLLVAVIVVWHGA